MKKRTLVLAWLLLIAIMFGVASQNWWSASYRFDQTQKSAFAAGNSFPMVVAAISFASLFLVAVLLTRGKASAILALVGAVITASFTPAALALTAGAFPESLRQQISKVSGIAVEGGSKQQLAHSGVFGFTWSQTNTWLFVVLLAALATLQVTTAVFAFKQPVTKRASKYQKPSTARVANSDAKDDAISLWDSQR